jgi:hypothetical protein
VPAWACGEGRATEERWGAPHSPAHTTQRLQQPQQQGSRRSMSPARVPAAGDVGAPAQVLQLQAHQGAGAAAAAFDSAPRWGLQAVADAELQQQWQQQQQQAADAADTADAAAELPAATAAEWWARRRSSDACSSIDAGDASALTASSLPLAAHVQPFLAPDDPPAAAPRLLAPRASLRVAAGAGAGAEAAVAAAALDVAGGQAGSAMLQQLGFEKDSLGRASARQSAAQLQQQQPGRQSLLLLLQQRQQPARSLRPSHAGSVAAAQAAPASVVGSVPRAAPPPPRVPPPPPPGQLSHPAAAQLGVRRMAPGPPPPPPPPAAALQAQSLRPARQQQQDVHGHVAAAPAAAAAAEASKAARRSLHAAVASAPPAHEALLQAIQGGTRLRHVHRASMALAQQEGLLQ